MCAMLPKVKASGRAQGGGAGEIPTPQKNTPGAVGAVEGAKSQGKPSSISARCELDDWRINLIEVRCDYKSVPRIGKCFVL